CKQVFQVQMTEIGPASSESVVSLSGSKLSNTPGADDSKRGSEIKSSSFKGISEVAKKTPTNRPPRWAGEAADEQPPHDPQSNAPLSPVLRSKRTLSGVILPGDRHIPALEVPWGSPCNPPKDFLK